MRQLFLVSFFSIIGLLFSAQAGDNIPGLTGDLQGMRSKLLKKGFHFGLAYTGEIYSNLSGGFRQQATYLDIINFRLKIDLGRTLNWHGATLYTDYLGIHGDDPSENVGDIQGVSNIAAPKGWKFHEAWFRQNVFSDKLSLLWGMYDLNTEFDLIETAGLFLNSSHGMGPDFSQGEIFSPSTFPATTFGMRIKTALTSSLSLQAGITDGVPGDLDKPWQMQISGDEGALIVIEITHLLDKRKIEIPGARSKSKKGRGRGKGLRRWRKMRGNFPNCRWNRHLSSRPRPLDICSGKVAIGGWFYTTKFEEWRTSNETDLPLHQKVNWGVYLLTERIIYRPKICMEQGILMYGRAGIADKSSNQFDIYLGGGIVTHGIMFGRPDDLAGIAIAALHSSPQYRDYQKLEGNDLLDWEVALEFTYRSKLTDWAVLQHDMQYIINPGMNPGLKNAFVLAARLELTF